MEETSLSPKDMIMQTEYVYRDWYSEYGAPVYDDNFNFGLPFNAEPPSPTPWKSQGQGVTTSGFFPIDKYAAMRKIFFVCGIVTNSFLLLLLVSRPLLVSREKLRFRSASFGILLTICLSHVAFLTMNLALDVKWPDVELYGFCLYDLAFVAFNTGQWLVVLLAIHTLLQANMVSALDGSTKQYRIWLVQAFVTFCMVVLVQFSLRHVNIQHTICALPNPAFQGRLYIFGYLVPTSLLWLCVLMSWLRIICDSCISGSDNPSNENTKRLLAVRLPATLFLTTVAGLALPFRIEPIISLFDVNMNDQFYVLDEISTIYYTLFPILCVLLVEVREMFASCLKRGSRNNDLDLSV